jgi:hypothetical protein
MSKRVWLGVLGAVLLTVASWNYFGAHRPVAQRLTQDQRNEKLTLWAYHRYGVVPGTLVVDLRGFRDDAAMVDVMRALIQSAEAHKDSKFERIVLAYKGTSKFLLDGAYFQKVGQEYESQNPVYTLRTFPENVFKLDGSAAYGTWTGGMLGVLGKQMEDLNQFSKDWYLDDALKEHSARH